MKRLILFIIWLYQNISFIPPVCRFYPSCSQYASEAIERYGLLLGLLKSLKRILRCHPFSPGGYDPVWKEE